MSSTISVSDSSSTTKTSRTSTGNKNMPSEKMLASPDLTFPWRLFLLLKHAEKENLQSVIAWTPDGTAFRVHKKQEFESTLLPKYFKMSKYRSFTRQLLAYGFTSAKRGGSQTGLFSHPEFLHDNPDGCYEISRRKSSTASKSSKKGNNNNETESPKPDSMATASPAMGVVLSAPDSNGADMQMMANNNVVANNNNLLQYTWANAAAAVGGSTDPKKIPPAVSMIPPFTSPMATPSASDSYLTTPSGFDPNQNSLLQLFSQLRQQQQQQQQQEGGMIFPISIVQPQAPSHGSPSHHSSTTTSTTSSTACDNSSQSSRSTYQQQQQHQQSPQIAAVAPSSSSATAGRGIPQMVDLTNNSGGTDQNRSREDTNKNQNFEPLSLDNDTLNMMNNLGTIPETGRLEGVVVAGASTSLHNNNNNDDDGSLSSPDDSEMESLEEITEDGVGETIPSIQNSQERKQDVQPPSLDDELESFDVNASTAGCFTKDCGVVAHHDGQQAMSISQRQEQDDDLLAMSDELFFEPTSIQDMKPRRRHTNKDGSNNSDDLMLSSLEPRPIEDMVVEPVPAAIAANANNPWYDWCPTMTPRQQALMEYSLPLVLPGIFYCFQLSKFGLAWCVFIVVGHTIETMLTSFGPSARDLSYRPMIVPLQHHLMDCMWLHTLISALIIGPTHFGPRGFVIGLGLIQTLPIYLSVSFKTHFEINHVLSAIKSRTSKDKEPKVKTKAKTKSQNVRKMGEHIRSCFLWYIASTICIMVGEYVLDRNFSIKMLGLFFVNFTPLYCGQCYRNQFDRSFETKEFIFQKSSLVLSTSLGEKDKAKQC